MAMQGVTICSGDKVNGAKPDAYAMNIGIPSEHPEDPAGKAVM